MTEVKPENNIYKLINPETFRPYLLCLLSLLLFACKKQNPKDISLEVPAGCQLSFIAELNITKTPVGYDTTAGINAVINKYYPVSKNQYLLNFDSVLCNNRHFKNESAPANKLALFSPACTWKAYSSEFGTFSYTDTKTFPGFTSLNLFNVDSIDSRNDFVLNLSGFTNYTHINVYTLFPYTGIPLSIFLNGPVQSCIIPKENLSSMLGPCLFGVEVIQQTAVTLNNRPCTFNKTLTFKFANKIY